MEKGIPEGFGPSPILGTYRFFAEFDRVQEALIRSMGIPMEKITGRVDMTESEWLECNDPGRMLEFMQTGYSGSSFRKGEYPGLTDRKLRFYCAGVLRSAKNWMGRYNQRENGVNVVEDLEAWADGGPAPGRGYWESGSSGGEKDSPFGMARYMSGWGDRWGVFPVHHCQILRCLFGNPFLPSYRWTDKPWPWTSNLSGTGKPGPMYCYLPRGWLIWRDGTIPRLAESIYADHRFKDLPLLADMLEEAGCEDKVILGHCRERILCPRCSLERQVGLEDDGGSACPDCHGTGYISAIHCRGCWVVDTLLGKS